MGFISTTFEAKTAFYLKRSGLTNTDMVSRLGISWPTWARYKKDPKRIPLGVFQDYAKLLQLSDEEIVEASRSWH